MAGWTRRGLAAGTLGMAVLARAPQVVAQPRGAVSMDLVDPELRPFLVQIGKTPFPPLSLESLPASRKFGTSYWPPRLASPAVVDRRIPGPPGAPDLRVLVVNGAPSAGRRPAILHIHGGGYVSGAPDGDVANLQRLALKLDCVAVSVDYRLAPETRFPGSLEDNYAALRWLRDSADALGIDARRIVVMGESAGGGHAAALAIAARDRGEIRLAGQVLVYPMLDDRTGSTRPPPAHEGGFMWSAADNRFGWAALLGGPAGAARAPAGAVPARVANLAGLPPAFIGVGALDLFVREDIEYATRLVDVGVPTELLVVPGAYHGFNIIVPDARVARQFNDAIDNALARFFAQSA